MCASTPQTAMEASLQALICARLAPHTENARDICGLIDAARLDTALGPLTSGRISM